MNLWARCATQTPHRLRKTILLMLALASVPAVQSAAQSSKAAPIGSKPGGSSASASITRLEKDIPTLMKEAEIPGLSIGLIADGQTWVHGFGVTDRKTNHPVTEDTIFNAASLSKTVFSYGVLKLVDEGKIGLDVPLSTYLPKPYIEGDDRLQKITARFVLSHRTGFPNWRGDGPLKIYFTPGERFSYSGEGMVYLQKVVEQITGKPLNGFMQETVFAPLGMKNSSYVWREEFESQAAIGHEIDGSEADMLKPNEANAAASLETTARDYSTFLAAVLAGTGLKAATLHEMETPQIAVNPECTNCTTQTPRELSKELFWGLGWGIEKTTQGESLWHWGDNGVYKAYVALNIDKKSGVVIFISSENGLSIAKDVVSDAGDGEQPALRWLKYDHYDSPAIRFAIAVRGKGAAAALKEFSSDLANGSLSEGTLNQEGYHLMNGKHMDDAILVLQKNVELHPASANTYDSLGEAYMNNHQNDLAIKNYEKSLELNPDNTNAVAMLKKIRGQ